MCGIAGFVTNKLGWNETELRNRIKTMIQALTHRGPDQEGVWVDERVGVAFGHKRLAILELSDYGRQPMISPSKRYVMVFNGEIYNFLEIRALLEKKGVQFFGHADSEVLLAAIDIWGIEEAILKCNGMFAIALWDNVEQELILIRDPMGIKPLYYGWLNENLFAFASELKAFEVFSEFERTINHEALEEQLIYGYISAPNCIYNRIKKVMPGSMVRLKGRDCSEQPYWDMSCIVQAGLSNPFVGSEKEAISDLENLMRDVIKRQVLADVPVGAFLSSGIDSSVVVSLMQAQSSHRIKTFTIGFDDEHYNEAKQAKKIAGILKTDHTELYVNITDVKNTIIKLPEIYDEPFSDSSQIPTYLVSKCAHQTVKVSLSGDGGDELFSGYNRYIWTEKIWKMVGWQGSLGRKLLSQALSVMSQEPIEGLFKHTMTLPGDKLSKLAQAIKVKNRAQLYQNLLKQIVTDEPIVYGMHKEVKMPLLQLSNFIESMMLQDTTGYLVNDILTKLDRASMAVSLEARVPLLDHELVKFAWRLPMNMKIRDNKGKWILRQILYKYLPRELVDQPKKGFAIPIGIWLKTELRDWAQSLLDELVLENQGLLNTKLIVRCWNEHLSGKRNWQYFLWNVLMFQAWRNGKGI